MAFNRSGIGEVIKDYLFNEKYQRLPNRGLARLINKQHPEFTTERLRSSIRGLRGVNGRLSRIYGSTKFYNQPYDLPPHHTYDSSNFILQGKSILVIQDIHFPYQDNVALKAMLDWSKKCRPKIDTVLLNGDIVDCYQESIFTKNPKNPSIKVERECAYDFLEVLQEKIKPEQMFWKLGNHEERLENYVFSKCPELLEEIEEDGLLSFETIFKSRKYGFKVIRDKRIIKIGDLNVVHGHEFGRGPISPVNPARTFFMKAKASTIGGHYHVTSEHSEKTINDKLITCWSSGCLFDLKPLYRPINGWNHGFSHILNDIDAFRVSNMRIENGVVY